MAASAAGFLLAAAAVERYPVSPWLVLVGVVVPSLGLGFVLDRFPWSLLGLVYLPIVIAATALSNEPVLIVATPFAVVAAVVAIAVGVAARRLTKRASTAWIAPAAGLAIAVGLVAPAVAWVQKHRTVRVHGTRPLVVDERRGTVGDVALGDPAARVRSVLGEPGRANPRGGIGPLDESGDSFLGPVVLPRLPKEQDLAYKRLFFAADSRGVRYLEVVDRRARLSRGVGPGDSISLLRDAYPRLSCDEGDAGEDEPVPFPRCHGWTGPGVYTYVAADYSKPGTPITEIWLADFDLVKGER
ncbi:MAG TPA: hypothetical protein VJU60_13230 [Thermoleophilaceae bacterium]|nr:hypothetical protein [Thermoleophilaceae bacterium]